MPDNATAQRKDAHLDICATDDVAPQANSTLLECVHLVHCALPELSTGDIDLSTQWFGRSLKAPLFILGMTGGTQRGEAVNRQLAQAAEEFGIAFGVGSQRAMLERPELTPTFALRDVAPTTVILGNIGLAQARELGAQKVQRLTQAIGADGLALHLNVGQELTQPEGDRDFRDGFQTVEALAKVYGDRLLVKETGCGLSPEIAAKLVACGVQHLDVSGLGGTSWIRVEQLRAEGLAREVGAHFSSWGIPTAAAVACVRAAVDPSVSVVASGGVRNGLEVAKALALGADVVGLGLPLFRAQHEGGLAGVRRAIEGVLAGLRTALALTGCKTPRALRGRPRVIVGALKDWIAGLAERGCHG